MPWGFCWMSFPPVKYNVWILAFNINYLFDGLSRDCLWCSVVALSSVTLDASSWPDHISCENTDKIPFRFIMILLIFVIPLHMVICLTRTTPQESWMHLHFFLPFVISWLFHLGLVYSLHLATQQQNYEASSTDINKLTWKVWRPHRF